MKPEYATFSFLEAWSPNYADQQDVEGVIAKFTPQEKKWMGPRDFYNKAQYRRVEWKDGKPICFVEARVRERIAKVNIGCVPKYRGTDKMDELWRISIEELKKMGIKHILFVIHKNNYPCQKFAAKFGMREITSPAKKVRLGIISKDRLAYYIEV